MSAPVAVFAPARIDLSPGFTDVAPLCVEVPGRVVNVALDLGVQVAVGNGVENVAAAGFVARLRDAVADRLAVERAGVRMSVPALPSGSGLGMSGALSVALAYAFSLLAGASVEPQDVAELACDAERETGLAGGTQDQLASVHGGAGVVHRHDGTGSRTLIDVDLTALGERMVLLYGHGVRNSGSIIEHVLFRRPRAEVLRTIRAMNVVSVAVEDSLRSQDYDWLAAAVNEATALLRVLHADIVDENVHRKLLNIGVSAAKPCGAGGPGAVWLAVVDPEARSALATAAADLGLSELRAVPSALGVRTV